jgi:hypothetical protein
MDESYKIPGYGQQIRSNFKAALRAYKPHLPFNRWGLVRKKDIFVSEADRTNISDLGSSDDEDEVRDQTVNPAVSQEELENEQNEDHRKATDTQTPAFQDAVDENSDDAMDDDKADQQEGPEAEIISNEDLKDNEVAEGDLENGEVTNEILEAGGSSTDDLDEVSDAEVTHEIRVEGPEGALQGLKEITIILKF